VEHGTEAEFKRGVKERVVFMNFNGKAQWHSCPSLFSANFGVN
jgi:hypothetical protein